MLTNSSHPSSISSGIGNNLESLASLCQSVQAEARLQQYRIEQQQQEIKSLQEKVQILELHKATQLGQDKIVGFMVGAIVLSLLSLATSIFFSPAKSTHLSLKPDTINEQQSIETEKYTDWSLVTKALNSDQSESSIDV
ncbi:hypothetical protein PN498_06515 [Oscillatoria sp. CS-180]|uniref:hypothetical protein n=1 Tax=Oscillatoria sp. CS-180 TaxID=3021720 RepID=UPI00232B1BFF|nr:hypothetical protein [Oscillatoria sp. CS-180]MDB9525634.1 hypothetical protein [Oscillatoria sp. CS-180]